MVKVFYTFFILHFFSYYFSQEKKDDWYLKKSEKGIEVYTRKPENSDFKEIKSVVYIKTSLNSIVSLISDWESYPKWVYRCDKSITLKKINEAEFMHYQTIMVPWPAEDRDFVVNVTLAQNEETKIVTIKSICNSNYIPPVKSHIRITELNASWTLVPLKDGVIEVTYQLLVNPGGSVPAWLVNIAAVDGPYETMINFKSSVMKKKYQDAKVSFIKELN